MMTQGIGNNHYISSHIRGKIDPEIRTPQAEKPEMRHNELKEIKELNFDPLQQLEDKAKWEKLLQHQQKSFEMIKDLLYLITPGMEKWIEKGNQEVSQSSRIDFHS